MVSLSNHVWVGLCNLLTPMYGVNALALGLRSSFDGAQDDSLFLYSFKSEIVNPNPIAIGSEIRNYIPKTAFNFTYPVLLTGILAPDFRMARCASFS